MWAPAPSQTQVIVVGARGAHSVLVTVHAPGGMPRAASDENPDATSSFGQFTVSYNNNPDQVTNISDLTQISGDRQIHIQITNSNIFPAQGESPIGFPILSYEITRPGRSITFLDKMMNNSNLTMDGVLLRGLHVRAGPWEFHGGLTSVTQFQDFRLPGNRYEVGAISRHFSLSKSSSLEGNLYYIDTSTQVNAGATTGPIATLLYQYSNLGRLKLKAEGGVGNGFAFAGAVDCAGDRQNLHADLRYESPKIATRGINQLHGRIGDLNWTARFSKRFTTQAFASDTSIDLPTEKQHCLTRELETEADGQFSLEGLPGGDYKVHLVDVSLPAGYYAGALEDSTVHVSAEHAGKIKIVLPAQRSITGKVELYDPIAGRTIPLNKAIVKIDLAGKISATDTMDHYLFRHLPSGTWTITCEYQGHHYTRTVSLAPNPDIEIGIDFTMPLAGLAAAPEPRHPHPAAAQWIRPTSRTKIGITPFRARRNNPSPLFNPRRSLQCR